MKTQKKKNKSKTLFSVVLISVLLFFTISSSTLAYTYPAGRYNHDMAYDSTNDVIIIYGGTTTIAYVDWNFETWSYDYNINEATNMNPAEEPYGSYATQMVFDSESEKFVSFGGHHAEDFSSDETWIYDYLANTWTPAAPNDSPLLRGGHCMAYDSESDVVIMHGGGLAADYNPYGGMTGYNDTWAYDLNTDTWTNMTPAVSPLGRKDAKLAYDSEIDRIIMFGGFHSPTDFPFNDPTGKVYQKETWAYNYNTNTWENATDDLVNPAPRVGHDLAYDSESDLIVLFGGYTHIDNVGMEDETWTYDYNSKTWTQMVPSTVLKRSGHSMAYDSENDLIILFGGSVSTSPTTFLGDFWSYDSNSDTWTLIEHKTTTESNFYILSLITAIAAISILNIKRRK